jgi:hypothetical protein
MIGLEVVGDGMFFFFGVNDSRMLVSHNVFDFPPPPPPPPHLAFIYMSWFMQPPPPPPPPPPPLNIDLVFVFLSGA